MSTPAKNQIGPRLKGATAAIFGGTRIGDALDALFNIYTAAQPSDPNRSWLPGWVRDAKYDTNPFTRWELTRKIRYFQQNMWLVSKLQELHRKYTVGPHGIPVTAASSDPEWNKAMDASYAKFCQNPCLDSKLPMSAVQKLIADEDFIDGEIFILKTRGKDRGKGQSFPRIQLIESHRCSSPGTPFGGVTEGNQNQVDGVEVDANGRPIGYWIRDGFDGESWSYKDAGDIIHIFEPDRVGQYRGITPFHSVLSPMHDLDDLEIMEMQRAKDGAALSVIQTTWNGELNGETLRRERWANPSSGNNPTNPSVNELAKRQEMYRQIIGSRTIAIKNGEKVEQFKNDSPSVTTQWYFQYKISQVCSATGIPMLLVLPASIQGTVARAILDDANLHFRSRFALYAHSAVEIYRYYADWARYNDPTCYDAPADWASCNVIPPRAVNVDIGHNATATIALVDAGMSSYDEVYGSVGSTAEIGLTKKARNIGMMKKIAAQVSNEMGVEVLPSEIAGNLSDIAKNLALADQAKAQADLFEAQANASQPAEVAA